MLEVLVSVREQNKEDKDGFVYKKPGDIIVAKISPAVWGNEEKKRFLITYLDDADLEASLREVQERLNDPTVVRVYPYKKLKDYEHQVWMKDKYVRDRQSVLENRSTKIVDLNHFASKLNDLRDKRKSFEAIKPDGKECLERPDLLSYEVEPLFPDMKDIIPEGIVGDYSITFETGTTVLSKGNIELMNDHLPERESHKEVVLKSKGDVLLGGLGIGLVIIPLLKKEEVKTITVIEIAQEVVDLVYSHIKSFDTENKLNLIVADAYDYEFEPSKKFDVMFIDILTEAGETAALKMTPEKKTKIEKYKKHLRDENSIFINRG